MIKLIEGFKTLTNLTHAYKVEMDFRELQAIGLIMSKVKIINCEYMQERRA
jgi:hypothetical protein